MGSRAVIAASRLLTAMNCMIIDPAWCEVVRYPDLDRAAYIRIIFVKQIPRKVTQKPKLGYGLTDVIAETRNAPSLDTQAAKEPISHNQFALVRMRPSGHQLNL